MAKSDLWKERVCFRLYFRESQVRKEFRAGAKVETMEKLSLLTDSLAFSVSIHSLAPPMGVIFRK